MRDDLFRYQRGSVLVNAAIGLGLCVIILGAVQIGYLFYAKREIQRVVDMAALAGAHTLVNQHGDDAACLIAIEDSTRHAYGNSGGLPLSEPAVACGVWDPNIEGRRHFKTGRVSGERFNAVRVTVTVNPIVLIPGFSATELHAEAVATAEKPTVAFSVGAQLLRFDNASLLGKLLTNVGLNIQSLTVLDSAGLAGATITPEGLLKALGLGVGVDDLKVLSPQGLADLGGVTVGRILDVMLSLVTNDSVLSTQLNLLKTEVLRARLEGGAIPLMGTSQQSGLFAFLGLADGSPVGAALDLQLKVSDILKTTLAMGVGGRGLVIPELNLLGVAVEAGIVEPPTIGIGPVGTTAHSAQVRLYLNIDTDRLLGGVLRFLLNNILGTRINLPVAIDVVSGTGTVTDIMCTGQPRAAEILVDSKVANVCVGGIPDANKWSGRVACQNNLSEVELIKLLSIPVLSGKTHIDALVVGDTLSIPEGDIRSTRANDLTLGNTVQGIVVGLLDLLGGLFRKPYLVDGSDLDYSDMNKNQRIEQMATQYLDYSKKSNGAYDVAAVTKLVIDGGAVTNSEEAAVQLPPLALSNWRMDHAIPQSCFLAICDVSKWTPGTFSEAFSAYTSKAYSVLDLLGISTLGGGYNSCAGLLSVILNWNGCVKNNLVKLLQQNSTNVSDLVDDAAASSILDTKSNSVACSGALCMVLRPVLEGVLKPVLNGVGGLLSTLLRQVLGIELSRTDVEVLKINCESSQLVY